VPETPHPAYLLDPGGADHRCLRFGGRSDGFVRLAVPHIVRAVIGPDYRWVPPYSFVAGRVVVRPAGLQVGIITARIGAPFLIYLARQRRVAG
jgi:ABC-type cobalamin transport system permease subunit